MADLAFKVGDVVKLASGGPDMTVMAVHVDGHPYSTGPDHVRTSWFDGENVRENVFSVPMLVLAK